MVRTSSSIRIVLSLLVILLLVSCGEMSRQQIDRQAEEVAAPLVADFKSRRAPTAEAAATVEAETTAEAGTTATAVARATSTVPQATTVPTTMPTAQLAAEQVLYLGVCCGGSFYFDTLDPLDSYEVQISSELFVGLTRQNEETAEVERGMAASWTESADGLVWTFTLRTDVPWVYYNPRSDQVEEVTDAAGQVRYVTAADFEYAIKRALDPELYVYGIEDYYIIAGAEAYNDGDGKREDVGVEALDSSTLEVRLTERAGYLDVLFDLPLSAAQPSWQIEEEGEDWGQPGSTLQSYGPYVLQEWDEDESLTLVRNPFWSGTESIPQPRIAEITWLPLDQDAVILAYLAGEVDVTELNSSQWSQVGQDPQFADQIAHQPVPCSYYYGFNTAKAPFDDYRVRRAFSLAIDRQGLVDEVLEGRGWPALWFTPPGLRAAPTAESMPAPRLTLDVETANKLLLEAYPNGDLPPITLAFNTSSAGHTEMAEAVQRMWQENLGVEVTLEPIDDFSDYLDRLEEDPPQIWRMGYCPTTNDAHFALAPTFHSVWRDALYASSAWSNSEFDDLLAMARSTTVREERAVLYTQAEHLLVYEEAAIIPLYWYDNPSLTQPYVERTYSKIEVERLEKWAVLEH